MVIFRANIDPKYRFMTQPGAFPENKEFRPSHWDVKSISATTTTTTTATTTTTTTTTSTTTTTTATTIIESANHAIVVIMGAQ